jgi:kynureninase
MLDNPVTSWFGHAKAFDFAPEFVAFDGIGKFAVSTPPILSMAAMEAGLDILLEAGMEKLREKSIGQADFLLKMTDDLLVPLGFELASPRDHESRGSHIALKHPEAYRINLAMTSPSDPDKVSIIPDFRPPDLIRIGIAPLYLSYKDIYRAVLRIRDILVEEEYLDFSPSIEGVP